MAQRGVNKVILVGNLGQDPDIRYMPNGGAGANFSVATSETWKDKNTGEQQESTEWHRCVAFRKLAEIIGEYAKKGTKVYIEGRLKTRKWQDQQGTDRYTTEILVDQFQMLGDSGSSSGQGQRHQSRSSSAPPAGDPYSSGGGFDDDDIPFQQVNPRV